MICILFFLISNAAATLSRRKYFEKYASQHKFDPLNPESWYSQPKDMVNSVRRHISFSLLGIYFINLDCREKDTSLLTTNVFRIL